MIGPLLNISQVADFLHVTVRTVYRWIDEGGFPTGRLIKGSRRWYYREIEDFVRFQPQEMGDPFKKSSDIT